MGKIAFVFSGQGAQHVGMGQDFYDRYPVVESLFCKAEDLRPGTMAQMFTGDGADLKQTQNTQPCLYLADMAAALALMENNRQANKTSNLEKESLYIIIHYICRFSPFTD